MKVINFLHTFSLLPNIDRRKILRFSLSQENLPHCEMFTLNDPPNWLGESILQSVSQANEQPWKLNSLDCTFLFVYKDFCQEFLLSKIFSSAMAVFHCRQFPDLVPFSVEFKILRHFLNGKNSTNFQNSWNLEGLRPSGHLWQKVESFSVKLWNIKISTDKFFEFRQTNRA